MKETVRFGTEGWRAMIARSFTFNNVQIFAQAVSDYILDAHSENKTIIVGYDTRFLADKFAHEMACVFTKNKIRVFFSERDVPVPSVAFSVIQKKTAGAVMITASSFSYEYCGIKFIPSYAGPAEPKIIKHIEKLLEFNESSYEYDSNLQLDYELFSKFDPMEDYLDYVKKFVDLDKIQEAQMNIVINPMYGTGRGYLESILEEICSQVIVINDHVDCCFGGKKPDPGEHNLEEDKRLVLENGFDLGISLDGDADRIGVIDKNGVYINPNQVMSLLLYHLISNRSFTGKVVKSVSSTRMLDRLCELFGVPLIHTPVGFKYISEKMRESDVIIGGEESGGLSIKGYLPEKDGILAALLVVELVAYEGKSLSEIMEELQKKTGYFYSRRVDIELDGNEKFVLDYFQNTDAFTLRGEKAIGKKQFDGVMYNYSDGTWFYVRTSGNRELLRMYFETSEFSELDNIELELKNIVQKIIKREVCV
ncbi:phosphoglucomutase/phosphomannomutase family protein [bacterium]|nr:phosphoglucomutase/phosphomannomutase family protein [bacterium]